ncbi:SigB/SigF/SigG family RNA polymerase sigma factor [Alkalithermobacter paradoxus]|uniref:RNA polymerase sigma-B factor n=1 Tax=Alkalithermobacter paradoxus TaxID=29349 RepID=A0A1V4I7E2_9FIRM|nr:RNA polymerase sigma-B factor [[Clostridium] thermoalcaliphilum]
MRDVAGATKGNLPLESLSDKELFLLYRQENDKNIRNILVERYLYIVDILAKKYINKGVEYEDIHQVGSLGLIYAIERFDIDKGFEFSSFATPTIIGEIKKYFRDKGWAIRVPRRIQELSRKVTQAKNHLEQENQKTPKIIDIANFLGCTEEEVLEAMDASYVYSLKSLDANYESEKDGKEVQIVDSIGYEDRNFDFIENKDFLEKVMQKLNDTEKKMIVSRFVENKTQMTIASEMGVSQMTVSRMEKKILSKIKKEYEKT